MYEPQDAPMEKIDKWSSSWLAAGQAVCIVTERTTGTDNALLVLSRHVAVSCFSWLQGQQSTDKAAV